MRPGPAPQRQASGTSRDARGAAIAASFRECGEIGEPAFLGRAPGGADGKVVIWDSESALRPPSESHVCSAVPIAVFSASRILPRDVSASRLVATQGVRRSGRAVQNPFDFFLEPQAETYPFSHDEPLLEDLEPFLKTEPITPRLGEWPVSGAPDPCAARATHACSA